MTVRLEMVADHAAVADRACDLIASLSPRAVALAGGRMPSLVYRLLADRGVLSSSDVWMVDERCVPPEHDDSNARLISESLRLPFHRMLGEETPEEAARIYEEEMLAQLGPEPVFDLVVLGMGADGHVASLFPGSPELAERARAVVATQQAHNGYRRVTLTLPVLNRARAATFVEAGVDKAPALARIVDGELLPAARVLGATWIVDRAAATLPPRPARRPGHEPIEGQEVLFEL